MATEETEVVDEEKESDLCIIACQTFSREREMIFTLFISHPEIHFDMYCFTLFETKRDKLLPKLFRGAYSSKEQGKRIPRQKGPIKGAGKFSAPPSTCMQMTPRNDTQTLGLLVLTISTANVHRTALGMVGSLTKRNCLYRKFLEIL